MLSCHCSPRAVQERCASNRLDCVAIIEIMRLPVVLTFVFVTSVFGRSWSTADAEPPRRGVTFQKRTLTDKYYCDGVNAGDFNRDGKPDIVAGPFWYEGPSFEKRHEFYPAVALPPEKSPSNSMFSYVWDFSGDGWDDILVLGRVHLHEAYWYENPSSRKPPAPPGDRGENISPSSASAASRPRLRTSMATAALNLSVTGKTVGAS